MKTVAIIGVGLMGGSLGIALRHISKNGSRQYEVVGIGRNIKKLQLAKDKNAVDCYSTDIAAVKCADIVFICSPVDMIVDFYEKVSKFVNKKAVICDIGSIKFNVDTKIKQLQQKNKDYPSFVGCHPMCGIEQNGIEYASLDIYNNANVVITANPKDKNTKTIAKLWKDVGCKVLFMSAKEHDETVAFTSHLPHIIAFSFYKMFREKKVKNKNIENLVAGSFKSLTRVAKSSPQMWIPIFLNNKNNLKQLSNELCKQIKLFTDTFKDEKKLKEILDKSVRDDNK
ncbi:MAG: prephenate dehydrogenase/arogenate dehydrogenase family protein [Endomicrobiaceae bacterium]|nr:prephenate dehydrogenase/arogenate dehydrogenase family protein [Endomicrobiaceae bacterium]